MHRCPRRKHHHLTIGILQWAPPVPRGIVNILMQQFSAGLHQLGLIDEAGISTLIVEVGVSERRETLPLT